jgi:hypothetical protein
MADYAGFHRAKVMQVDADGRIRATIPAITGAAVSGWIPSLLQGSSPTVDEVVWVTFESGNRDRPFYLYPSGVGGGSGGDGGAGESLTTSERDALDPANIVEGRIIYHIDAGRFERWTGSAWVVAGDFAIANHSHSITEGTTGTLTVARGGTGATTAAGARSNLSAAAANHDHDSTYVNRSGDTLTGAITITNASAETGFMVGSTPYSGLSTQGDRVTVYSRLDGGWAFRSHSGSPVGTFRDAMTLNHSGDMDVLGNLNVGGSLSGVTHTMVGAAPTSHNHAAGDVTSGAFADARIPNLNASKITAGTFNEARIPSLDYVGNATGTWHNSTDGNPRFHFTSGTHTYVRSAGTGSCFFRNGNNNNLLVVTSAGRVTFPQGDQEAPHVRTSAPASPYEGMLWVDTS